MPVGIRRIVFSALVIVGLVAVAGTAQAQSATDLSPVSSGVSFDAARAVAPSQNDTAQPTFLYRARPNVSFQANQGQLGSEEDQGIGVGVLGMITRASFDLEDDFFDVRSRTGYGFGLWVGGNRNGRVGFVGEFIYAVRNGETEDGEDVSFKVFQIPAVFHVNVGSRSRNSVGGYIVAGPVFTFNIGQTVDGEDIDEDSKFKGADIGIIGGAGIEFFRIGIEGRGNWGLRSISDEGDFNKIKTFTFELLGKFAFN
jgi:hypothetical protein